MINEKIAGVAKDVAPVEGFWEWVIPRSRDLGTRG